MERKPLLKLRFCHLLFGQQHFEKHGLVIRGRYGCLLVLLELQSSGDPGKLHFVKQSLGTFLGENRQVSKTVAVVKNIHEDTGVLFQKPPVYIIGFRVFLAKLHHVTQIQLIYNGGGYTVVLVDFIPNRIVERLFWIKGNAAIFRVYQHHRQS